MKFTHPHRDPQSLVLRSKNSGVRLLPSENGARTDPTFRDDNDPHILWERFVNAPRTRDNLASFLQFREQNPACFQDFSQSGTFEESMNIFTEAKQAFLLLPSSLRAKFKHSPERFYDFLDEPNNFDEALRLGLIRPPADTVGVADPPPLDIPTPGDTGGKK